jgi:Flp pilus assembly protein TadG
MRRFLRNKTGGASLELCLVTPMLIVMMIGIYDMGFLLYGQSQVETAADAGALYAAKQGFGAWNAANVTSATQGASYPIAVTATPAPYTACGCPSGATAMVPQNCGTPCADGVTSASHYAVVSAQATMTPIINWPGYPAHLAAGVVTRLQP